MSNRRSTPEPWQFAARTWGGYETPRVLNGMAIGSPSIAVHVHNPTLDDSGREAAARYFSWRASIFPIAIGLLGLIAVGALLSQVVDARMAFLVAIAVTGAAIFGITHMLRTRALEALENTRSVRVHITPGQKHWFKPDTPARVSDPDLVDALEMLDQVEALHEAGLVTTDDWTALQNTLWTHLGRTHQVRDALGWDAVTTKARSLIARARQLETDT